MSDQLISTEVARLEPHESNGYLSTLLIRKVPLTKRHQEEGL